MNDFNINNSGIGSNLHFLNPSNLFPAPFVNWFQKNCSITIGKLKPVDIKISALCAVILTSLLVVGFALRSRSFRALFACLRHNASNKDVQPITPSPHISSLNESSKTTESLYSESSAEKSIRREPFDINVFKKVVAESAYYDETWCIATAWYVVEYITGETPRPFEDVQRTRHPFSTFLDRDDAGQYKHQYAMDFFDKTSEKSSVFHFYLPKDLHSFAILKKVDGDGVKYIVFQSCFFKYNLKNWLGVVEATRPDFKNWSDYTKFGDGKEVTEEEICEFMAINIIYYADRGDREIRMHQYDL